MAKKDMHNNILQKPALNPQAIATDTTTAGVIIDTQGFESVEFIIQSATITDGTYTPLIEEGDASDLSDASAVADADLLGTEAAAAFAAADDNEAKRVGYKGQKRYVRLSLVSAGTSTGGTLAAIAVLGHPHVAATDAQ